MNIDKLTLLDGMLLGILLVLAATLIVRWVVPPVYDTETKQLLNTCDEPWTTQAYSWEENTLILECND